ncbi:tRNA 2-selenouridine(34) synthase MnmH [Pelagivirga sediminicola]|uniref:tRNA 2-selenouridine(34) synthase MnmH n=1 Tax=Pelagivirga sediminicola TaxID=2170575 RepID=A0A2T7G8V4_9RHOB|nr:tRNA 2-selenouridine(34) synthase MnmH [Pelagivirga sediminicola]PVA10845.1 tRNA 2-selenouridine(34) synthase MnmH [Pelagivirga sediminicola]
MSLASIAQLADLPVDTLIDARSPAEYAEDHLPGAINLPSLSDAERAEVGTIYVQQDRFKARRIGAALVARNVAAHLEGPLSGKDGSWRPLVYCWRGGQRSGSFASILEQIGWRTTLLDGGYRAYRRLVVNMLYDAELALTPILLDGNTGTAKTRLLELLEAQGVQVIDLEGLANHRGSALGARPGGQPTQKLFEGRLAQRIAALDPARPVVIEAESHKVGTRILPPSLWGAMKSAPSVRVTAPVAARAAYLARAYGDMTGQPDLLKENLDLLRHLRGHETVDRWQQMVDDRDFTALAGELIVQHYDPGYESARARHDLTAPQAVELTALDDAALEAALPRLIDAIGRAAGSNAG